VPEELDLAAAGVSTVIWATGYRPDLGWVRLPILDADGWPRQRRGVTEMPGLSILGLDWLHSAKSGLFRGVGEDAAYLAAVIADQRAAAVVDAGATARGMS
jgi:putative flavoprotein involved in K+ transport